MRDLNDTSINRDVYLLAKSMLADIYEALGDTVQDAKLKAEKESAGLLCAANGYFTMSDGSVVRGHIFPVASDLDNKNKSDIAEIDGCKYRHEHVSSYDIIMTDKDAIYVKRSFDSYKEIDGRDEFSRNVVIKQVSLDDIRSEVMLAREI